jgi:hypothetical protein
LRSLGDEVRERIRGDREREDKEGSRGGGVGKGRVKGKGYMKGVEERGGRMGKGNVGEG